MIYCKNHFYRGVAESSVLRKRLLDVGNILFPDLSGTYINVPWLVPYIYSFMFFLLSYFPILNAP